MTTSTIPFDADRARRIAAAREAVPDHAVDRVAEGMFRTDALIDSAVADFATMGRGVGWRILGEMLHTKGPSLSGTAPDSLRELLTPLLNPPDWFDPEQVRRGAQLWWRFAPAVIIGLGGTLMTAYAFGDLNKPQAMNSRSEAMAAQRYEETSRWVLAATAPGALIPGGTGFDATIRIRFVHAMVRRHLRTCGKWQRTEWGEPIHTSGMAVTIDGFLLMPLAMHELLDMDLREDEREAIRQLWFWIGYLMGVPDELLPHSIDDAADISRAATIVFAPPDEDTEVLTKALLRGGLRAERVLPKPLWPIAAPVVRPVMSTLVWGGTGRIVNSYSNPEGTPPRNHPVILTLRQVAKVREHLRRKGRLGTDQDIALRQRAVLEGALNLMKAVTDPVDPRHAVTPARP
ncbi:oxygenase MpaB family protein [Nocardia sp. NPDC051030]|uniref:oxygenase MpaB family protein n=1 Tax=Nocardia sp. NPDC051030 TaxID=3155162 RepID=UPI003412E237